MKKVKIYFHKEADTLDIWFGDPDHEVICEEAGEGIILKKDKENHVIGVEKLFVSKSVKSKDPMSFEVVYA